MTRTASWTLLLVLVALAGCGSGGDGAVARAAATTVSIEFDDGAGQAPVRALLARHRLAATFFINSGFVERPGYLTWAGLRGLAADGHEIAGHTSTHPDLTRLPAASRRSEICGDRRALIAHGLRPVSFAYPYGAFSAATERIVRACGYDSGRRAWGLHGRRCATGPPACPYAVDPARLRDRWAIATAPAPVDATSAADVRAAVQQALDHGGGWVQIFWHRICDGHCHRYSWPPARLDSVLRWLRGRADAGALRVATVRDVLHSPFRPAPRS